MERRGWLSGDESEAAVGVQARGRGGTETDEDGDGEGWLQRSRLEASVGVRACGGRREARVVKKDIPVEAGRRPRSLLKAGTTPNAQELVVMRLL